MLGESKGVCLLGRRAGVNVLPEKGRQRAVRKQASVGRGKAKLFPLQGGSLRLNPSIIKKYYKILDKITLMFYIM